MSGLLLKDVTVSRGDIAVLSGLSFELSPGKMLWLRGPNGIGKTTLLRTIAGLQAPVTGTIESDSRTVYFSHANAVKLAMSVGENLRFWMSVYGRAPDRARLDDILAACDLTKLRDRTAGLLSAGQQRRLGLARLLISDAALWLLDEPTVSLDAAHRDQFIAQVAAHCRAGGMALFASHIELGQDMRVLDLAPYRAAAPELSEDWF